MLKNLFIITLLITSLVACKSKSAFNYSQDMVAKDKAITTLLEGAENKIAKYATANQYDSIVVASEDMEKQVQKTIDEVNATPVPNVKEADNFKAAMLRYFNYMKSLYTGYKKFGKASTDEEREQAKNDQQKLVDEKRAVLSDIQSAQKKYADANGFKVQ